MAELGAGRGYFDAHAGAVRQGGVVDWTAGAELGWRPTPNQRLGVRVSGTAAHQELLAFYGLDF